LDILLRIISGQKTNSTYRCLDAHDDHGVKFSTYNVENWFDCGKKDALLETNAVLLKKSEFVTDNLQFENTIIIQPVNIDASWPDQQLDYRPNVSIGARTMLKIVL